MAAIASHHVDPTLLSNIVEYPGPFESDEDQAACARLVDALTPDEQEIAARVSYAYWAKTPKNEDERKRSAMKVARRHYVGEGRDFDSALQSLRHTCAFREEWKIDSLRYCFGNSTDVEGLDMQLVTNYETMIETELKAQSMVIRGHDKEKRPIIHRSHRVSAESDPKSYALAMMYLAERAFACVEVLSEGREEKVVLVSDYSQYESSLAPPMDTIKQAVTIMQKNCPERAKQIFVLDPPFWMRGLYAVISLFLSTDTNEKLQMASGSYYKDEAMKSVIDEDHATTYMLSEGKLPAEFDLDRFLRHVPFASLYSE